MPQTISFHIDMREFNEALDQYLEVTTRSLADVLNKKALYVARGALRRTPSTAAGAIKSSLGQIVHKNRQQVALKLVSSQQYSEVPLAALIITARRGRASMPGLYGAAMTEAIRELIDARQRSRNYLKSGWIPAIKIMQASVIDRRETGEPDRIGPAKVIGPPKGTARPAHPGFTCQAMIENAASAKHETHEALHKYGGPALQAAFDAEAHSMTRFVADRQYEEAKKIGIKAFVS